MSSGTLRAKERRDEALRRGQELLDGGLGENPVPVPRFLRQLVDPSRTRYTSCHGSHRLQDLIGTDRIITGNSLKELLAMIQLAFSETYVNSLIVFPVPHWPTYVEQAKVFNLDFLQLRVSDLESYKVQPKDIEGLPKHRKILLFLNNPCNPTGVVYSKEELRALAKVCRQRKILVLADDIYRQLSPQVESIPYEQTIRGTSLSKVIGSGGYRFGWLTFPPSLDTLFQNCKRMASTFYTCPSAPFLPLAETMVENPPELQHHTKQVVHIFSTIFQEIIRPVLQKTLIQFTECRGAWYTLLDFSAYTHNLHELGITTSHDLVNFLFRHKKLLVVAGSEFGFEETKLCIRYSFVDVRVKSDYTFDPSRIEKACLVLEAWTSQFEVS